MYILSAPKSDIFLNPTDPKLPFLSCLHFNANLKQLISRCFVKPPSENMLWCAPRVKHRSRLCFGCLKQTLEHDTIPWCKSSRWMEEVCTVLEPNTTAPSLH